MRRFSAAFDRFDISNNRSNSETFTYPERFSPYAICRLGKIPKNLHPPPVQLGPFFRQRQVWLPTWRTCLLAILLLVSALVIGIRSLPGFLSPDRPLNAPVLVIEGWASEYVLRRALALDATNHYQLVIVTGGPIEKGMDISSYEDYANLGASRLMAIGFANTNIVKLPAPKVPRDRTYHAALTLKEYMLKRTTHREADLIASGVHGRRSWMLYNTACRPEIKVGVIAQNDESFDMKNWWRTSYGVRGVTDEFIGYLYAKFVFNPE